jgi:triosephosphate isomerase
VLAASLIIIIVCVGDTLDERESGKTEAVVQEQSKAVVETIAEEVHSSLLVYLLILKIVVAEGFRIYGASEE